MKDFSYLRAASVDAARQAAALPGAMLLAGGTTLIDLAKCGVAEPERLVDITHLKGWGSIEVTMPISRAASPPSPKPCGKQPRHRSATWRPSAAI